MKKLQEELMTAELALARWKKVLNNLNEENLGMKPLYEMEVEAW